MKAITKFLAGGVAVAALAGAAPAAAQYYPGYSSPYGGYGTGNVVGTIVNSVIGNGYSPYGSNNSQAIVNQCANAVQARLSGGYNGYANGGAYGYNSYGGGRVLGISQVEQRGNGLRVRGVATSGRPAAYGQGQVDLVWRCNADFAGRITRLDVNQARSNYGYKFDYNQYTPWNDYSQYGYRRY